MVRVSNPAPASSTTDTATCATTSARCRRCLRNPPLNRRAPAAIHAAKLPSFGTVATNESSSASATASASAKPSTTRSSRISLARGEYRSAREMSNPTPPIAMITPRIAPMSVSARFSTSISRRSRDTPAPRDARTTSSCSRRTPRMSVRLTTLAAEMIITNAAAAMSSQSVRRARSPIASLNGMTATR